jgi:protein disulfide-isomerase A1
LLFSGIELKWFLVKVDGSERLEEGTDQASQISQFLEGYRAGRTTKKKISGPSFMGFLNSLVSLTSLYILIFVIALLFVMVYFAGQDDTPQPRRIHEEWWKLGEFLAPEV